jgi:hypothetical protein
VDEFIQALRAHAAAVEHLATPGARPESIDPAIDVLRAAALAYDEAVFERSGLGDAFADLGDELDEFWDDDVLDDDGELEPEFVVEDGVQRISLTGRWDFLVRDPQALREHAEQQLRADIPDIDDETLAAHAGEPGSALNSLVGHQGLFEYPGLEDAGAQWSVGPITRTLFEMSDDELDESTDDIADLRD